MKKLVIILMILTALVALLVSCGDKEPAETTTEAKLVAVMTDTASSYTAVYPLSYSFNTYKGEAVKYFEELVKENSGGAIAIKSDFLAGEEAAGSYEILLGATNRPESIEAMKTLRRDDYLIGFVNGKLCAIGGSDEASAKAIRHFATMFFSKTQNDLVLPETFYQRFDGSYPLNSLTVFGTPIDKVAIVAPSSLSKDAESLKNGILELTGYTLPTVTKRAENDGIAYAITLSAENDGGFTANAEGITIAHTDALTRSQLVTGLLATCQKGAPDAILSENTAFLKAEAGTKLSIVDLNVYSTGFGENSVVNRYPRLMTYLANANYPTVLALQDVSPTWIDQFDRKGEGFQSMNEVYGYIGEGRNADDESVMQAVFYRKDLVTLVRSGTFWLSETPDICSVGWDGRTRSTCAWAVLRDNATGQEFAVMSTMLDPYGKNARLNGIALILERAADLGCPVILCGDLNVVSKNSTAKKVTNGDFFDAQSIALSGDKTEIITAHNAFGSGNELPSKSDFIFTSYGDFTVNSHAIDKTKIENGFISNHWILYADISLLEYRE